MSKTHDKISAIRNCWISTRGAITFPPLAQVLSEVRHSPRMLKRRNFIPLPAIVLLVLLHKYRAFFDNSSERSEGVHQKLLYS